jgi:hypothetical protein
MWIERLAILGLIAINGTLALPESRLSVPGELDCCE